MSLKEHAKYELEKVGLFDKDSDYGGMIGKAVMELIEKFSEQGHSEFSAMQVLAIFNKLASFKPLSKITSDPDEWNDVSGMSGKPMWQNKRCSSSFSEDGGKTWYDLNWKDTMTGKRDIDGNVGG